MRTSRRDLACLLAAAPLSAQQTKPRLATKTYLFEDLPVRERGLVKSRAILDGLTHTGFPIEIHMTELAPGEAPHGSHRHPNDEMVIVHEGKVEVTVEGKTAVLTPGSVAYLNSGEEHGLKNAGAGRARYYIVALGPKSQPATSGVGQALGPAGAPRCSLSNPAPTGGAAVF
jgi:quercetin dioxygenase-like cupin family protein